MQFKVIELSTFISTKSQNKYGLGFSEPYSIWFVYPKDSKPLVVKGMSEEVQNYVERNYPLALCRYTMWKNGQSRGGWRFTGTSRYISREGRRYKVSIYSLHPYKSRLIRQFTLRRVPRKWIPEFEIGSDSGEH